MAKMFSVSIYGEGFDGVINVKANDAEEAIERTRQLSLYSHNDTKIGYVEVFCENAEDIEL